MIDRIENNSEIIKEIQDRFRFVILVVIFFLGLLYNFFNEFRPEKSDNIVLSYSILIVLYILIYILFEVVKKRLILKWLKTINSLMIINIGIFIIPISFLSLSVVESPNKIILFILPIFFKITLYGILIIPIFILFTLSFLLVSKTDLRN